MNMNGQFLVLAVYWWYKQEVYLVQVPYTFI